MLVLLTCTSRALIHEIAFEPRRVLIVIGDGNDNASNKSLSEVLEVAQRNLVTIYGISTVAYGFYSAGSDNLTLAEEIPGARRISPAKCLQGHKRIPIHAVGRRKFCLSCGLGGICVRAGVGAVPLGGERVGRNHHPIYLALHSQRCGAIGKGFPGAEHQGRAAGRQGAGPQGLLSGRPVRRRRCPLRLA